MVDKQTIRKELTLIASHPWMEGEEFNEESWKMFHILQEGRMKMGERVIIPGRVDDMDMVHARVMLDGRNRPLEVTVSKKSNWGDRTAPVAFEVNWGAHGSQSPDYARVYASLIEFAATVAELLPEFSVKEV